MKLLSNTSYFKGKKEGPTVVVLGGTHGDEQMGAEIVELLEKEIKADDINGEIYLFLGNPEACKRNQRFMDTDLNRLFGEEFEKLKKMDEKEMNTEQKRVMEIAPILEKADYLLDIHSTIKPSVPFVYCEPDEEHFEFARLLGTKYIVSASPDFRPKDLTSSIDNFVDQHGGMGVTYESGWHKDDSTFKIVLNGAKLFLQHIGSYDFGLAKGEKINPEYMLIHAEVVPNTKKFSFSEDFSNFDFVAEGEVIATDGSKKIKAEQDSFIIFPKKNIQAGKVACYLAHKNK